MRIDSRKLSPNKITLNSQDEQNNGIIKLNEKVEEMTIKGTENEVDLQNNYSKATSYYKAPIG